MDFVFFTQGVALGWYVMPFQGAHCLHPCPSVCIRGSSSPSIPLPICVNLRQSAVSFFVCFFLGDLGALAVQSYPCPSVCIRGSSSPRIPLPICANLRKSAVILLSVSPLLYQKCVAAIREQMI